MSNTVQDVKIFHFEDFDPSVLDENRVGRKGLSLFKLHSIDAPVPDFFVISPQVFSEFTQQVFTDKSKELLEKGQKPEEREISSVLNRGKFDKEVEEEIIKSYTRISGFSDAWVSVRSSVSFPQKPNSSFSGVFRTELNVRGVDNILKAIKEVYSSVYTDNVLSYCQNENIELADVSISVVVQRMVQAEVSGVSFTVDPITQDKTKMSIEAVYGLGDVIANGEITPDMYSLNKKDLSIVEKHIAPQEWMKVRTLGGRGTEAVEKIQISNNWSHKQKIDDKHMVEVAKISLLIEDRLDDVQDIEWVLSGGRIWVLQTKSVAKDYMIGTAQVQIGGYSLVSDALYKVVKEIVQRGSEKETMTGRAVEEAKRYLTKERDEVVIQPQPKYKPQITKDGQEFLLTGIGASFGVAAGVVKIVKDGMSIDSEDVVVMKAFKPELSDEIMKSAGVIMESGGLTSDIAIMCRERNIPAIVGANGATEILKDGESVKIDGNLGSVSRVNIERAQGIEVAKEINERIEEAQVQIQEEIITPVEENRAELVRDIKLPRTATKVLAMCPETVEVGLVNSDGVCYLELDKLMMEDGRHPLAYVEDKKYKEYADKIGKMIDAYADVVSPNELIVSIGSRGAKSFKELTRGKDFEKTEENLYGASHYIDNKKLLVTALRIVKRVRNVMSDRNVSLAIHSPMNGNLMKEIKKEISGKGLRRTSTFNIYAVVENPAEVIVIDDILDAGIDGVILNTPRMAMQMQGVPVDDPSSRYDMTAGSVLKVVDQVLAAVKESSSKLYAIANDDKDFVEYCVKKGVHGVSVLSKKTKDYYTNIAEIEAKILMGVSL